MQFVKNVLVYVFGVFTFSFCYCFYEGFIDKFTAVGRFLPFICISYPLKDFKFDTRILRDSYTIPLLKPLSRLPQGIVFYVWFCFSCLLAIIFFLLTLSKSMFFELAVLIPLLLYLIRSVSAEVSLNCISCIRFRCSFFWPWENQYMVHGFDSISIAQFPAMICSV